MELKLAKMKSFFVYKDDILVVTKGTKHEHLNKMREVLKILHEAYSQLKVVKRMIAQESIVWLGYNLTRTGISSIKAKTQGLGDRLRPAILKNCPHS